MKNKKLENCSMKFTALLKKELRICLPWLLLGAVVFLVFGALTMKSSILFQQHNINQGYESYNWPRVRGPIGGIGLLLLMLSVALGVILAVVQFFLPGLFKTWSFTIHRSIPPGTIILSKFIAAVIAFIVSLGLLWTLFYSYAAASGRFHIPIFFRTYLEGWVYISAGLMAYLGVALSSVSTAHIYTTRGLGIAVGLWFIVTLLSQNSISSAVIWAVVGACILIVQIFHTFLTREF